MLQFPEHFFESESREGFLVDSTMKSVWAAEMEVLYEIAAVCEKYQLPWYAGDGTLLGAVRHKGFIPWDDDIDIWMLREDYEKLIQVLPQELPEGWVVYHTACGQTQGNFWACVMNSKYLGIDKERMRRFHGCPFIVGVDIMPFDYLPRDTAERELEEALYMVLWKAAKLAAKDKKSSADESELKELLEGVEEFFVQKIDFGKDLVSQLWMLANELCRAFGENGGDHLVCFQSYMEKKSFVLDKSWFDETEYLPFESVFLPVPAGYDNILTVEYGDYRVYEKNTQSHDYPFYNKQLEQLRKQYEEAEKRAGQGER